MPKLKMPRVSVTWHRLTGFALTTHSKRCTSTSTWEALASGCRPGAEIEEVPSRFEASKIWNANRKLGQSVAFAAMDEAIALAVSLWYRASQHRQRVSLSLGRRVRDGCGQTRIRRLYQLYGGACRGRPFHGQVSNAGHESTQLGDFRRWLRWGNPIVIDWATSVVAMGRVQQFRRGRERIAAQCGSGRPMAIPPRMPQRRRRCFRSGHTKDMVFRSSMSWCPGLIGGSLPTLRSRPVPDGEKRTCCFYFQVIHPDAVSGGAFA